MVVWYKSYRIFKMNVSNVFNEPAHTHKHILCSITHDGLMELWGMEALALSLSLSSLHKIFCIDIGFVISLLMQIEIINDDDDDQCWYLWCISIWCQMESLNLVCFEMFSWSFMCIWFSIEMDGWKNQNASLTRYIISSSILSNLSSSLRRKDFAAQVVTMQYWWRSIPPWWGKPLVIDLEPEAKEAIKLFTGSNQTFT